MDEESAAPASTLSECIRAASAPCGVHQHRFSSHGRRKFHPSMEAAAVLLKGDLKRRLARRLERQNVDIGLAACLRAGRRSSRVCGPCRTSWRNMLRTKISQPQSGANTAWCPPRLPRPCMLCLTQSEVARDAKQLAGLSTRMLDDILTPPWLPIPGGAAATSTKNSTTTRRASWLLGALDRCRVGFSKVPYTTTSH